MKVLFVTTFGIEYKGGANISSQLLAGLLRENGVEVERLFIKTRQPKNRLDRFLSSLSEDFYQTTNPVLDMLVRKKVTRCVESYRPDIVDVQDRYSIAPIAGRDLGDARKVFTVVDELSMAQLKRTHHGAKRVLLEIRRKEILKRLKAEKHLIATSNYGRDVLVDLGVRPDRVQVMYRSLPPRDWYERRLDEDEVRHGADRRTRFLMPGRISHERGVEMVLRAVSELNGEGLAGDFEVLMIGKGAMSGHMKKAVLEEGLSNMSVAEPVPIEEMLSCYTWSDVVLLPVLGNEMFGRGTLESMLVGRPVITTMRGGTREIVDGIEGSHVTVDSQRDLTEAMRRFITDRGLAGRMKEDIRRQRDRITARFNHRDLADRYLEYYREVLRSD